ncbi:MAG: ATP-binding cassette domain-containing protein, partial [Rudaea sp.]
MSALLEVEGLDVHYGDTQALWNVSITAQAGEFIALIGPNGAGKTTLLRTVQGLLRPTRGVIRLGGERIDAMPAYRRVERGLASIPESRHLFPEMTV